MQKIEQGEYFYQVPESAQDALLDFLKDAIAFKIDYYLGACRADDEDQDSVFEDIQTEFEMYANFKDGNFDLHSYDQIYLLDCEIEWSVFEQIRKYPDIDNPAYLYEILSVWKELDAIVRDHISKMPRPTY